MKLFLIRYTKIVFTLLRTHGILNGFSPLFLNLYYLTKFSLWARKYRNIPYNDFPSKWDYKKRYNLHDWVSQNEKLQLQPISYLEFGVAQGESFRRFVNSNDHPESRFWGFDTFTGLPEDWGQYKKGTFNNEGVFPKVNDTRATFMKGLFQETLPGFLKQFDNNKRNVIMLDADLYTSTLFVLTSIAPYLKKDDLIFFDEFNVPTHEFRAYIDFVQSYYVNLQLIAAANNYLFTAFKVI